MLERTRAEPCAAVSAPDQGAAALSHALSGRVLLVEDNEVNRRVAATLLGKMGLEVGLATNGREALQRLEHEHYQLVLMDMHMPEMDGLEATRAIRERERKNGGRMPVIAMTANVLSEARAACCDAGMDGFIAKPFVARELTDELQRWLPLKSLPPQAEIVPLHAKEPVAKRLDPERVAVVHGAMGDHDFAELVDVFLQSAQALLVDVDRAIAAGDDGSLYRSAHTLKSSAANLGALELSRLAKAFEGHARAGALSDCSRLAAALNEELDRARPLLQQARARMQQGVRNAAG